MAKDLKSILAGVKSSKTAPPEINDKNTYQWNAKDGVAFIKKHKIETHADRAGNGDDVYKGKTKKTDKYKFQSDGVYEETEEESELDEAERVRFIGKQNPADLPPRPADYKPGDFGSKLAAGGGLRYPGKKKPSRPLPLPVKESDVDENYMGFHALKGHLTQTGAKSPSALAAWIGREKYGKEKFQAAAAKDKKLGEGAGCNHTMEGVMCEVHGESACPTKENDVNMQKSKKKDSKGREYLADKKKVMEEAEYIEEVLTAKDPVSKWIHDFVHSDNPKFAGKSTKERQKMALGAYYDKKRGVKESGSATNTDYTGPGAAGWTTGRHDMGTL
jgi:hypothetical protein